VALWGGSRTNDGMDESVSEKRRAVLGAVACCVRDEMTDALDLLSESYEESPNGWGEVAVELARERVQQLAEAVGRPVEHIAATLSDAADDVRARWVLQAACSELIGDRVAAELARDAISREHGLHNAVASAVAVAGLLHAQAAMCGADAVALAQVLCLEEALRT
jgi:hypothetical protein